MLSFCNPAVAAVFSERLMKTALALSLLLLSSSAFAALVGKDVSYKAGDTVMKGHLVYDDAVKGKRAGVLVVPEWWGANDYARKRARMLASEGYVALVVDMYGNGQVADNPKDAGALAGSVNKNPHVSYARLDAARAFLDADSTYLLDCQRLVGDCLLKLGRNEEVIRHFENLLIDHPGLAWAKMGLARARFHLDRYDESRDILESLVAENGDFAQAHDLLARVHEVKGSSQKSRALLKEVLIRNPRAIHRHREVVRMALDIGDTQDAVAAYEGMFSHGAGSVSVSPSDFAGFGSLLLQNPDQGNVQRLTQLISVLNDYYLKLNTGGDQTGYQVAELVAQFARARLKGNGNETARFYEQIGTAVKDLPAVDNEMKLSLMEVAIAAGDQAKASEIAREVLADYHGNESMTRRILGTLENGGLGSEAEAMRLDTERAVADLNRKAVTLAKSGKPKEAMVEFMRLADTTRNLSITFNAALAIVHWLESAAPEDMLSRKLAHYIEVIRNRDPANPRTRQIEEMAQPYLRVAASMGAAANGRP